MINNFNDLTRRKRTAQKLNRGYNVFTFHPRRLTIYFGAYKWKKDLVEMVHFLREYNDGPRVHLSFRVFIARPVLKLVSVCYAS